MNELIKLQSQTIDGNTVETVNARELHAFLESRQEFANWIKSRIADFGFIDNQDFLTILSKTSNGGRPSREYYITLDMAKELPIGLRIALSSMILLKIKTLWFSTKKWKPLKVVVQPLNTAH